MKLACQEHLVPGDSLERKWELLAAAGYDGIELHGHGDLAFERRLPELRRARTAGVPLPTVCVIMDHFIGDFDGDRRRDALVNMRSLLSTIAAVDGVGAITPASFGMHSNALPPFRSPRPPQEERRILLEALHELGEHAAREGVLVLLEPLNRYEDHMLNRLEQAVELCRAVELDSVRVMGDLFHMNIEEDDLAGALRDADPYVAHIHLADSNRAQPGAGHTDFAGPLRGLERAGFDGYLALECGIRGDAAHELPRIAAHLRTLAQG